MVFTVPKVYFQVSEKVEVLGWEGLFVLLIKVVYILAHAIYSIHIIQGQTDF